MKQLAGILDMFNGHSPIPTDLRCLYDVLSNKEKGEPMEALELLYSSSRVHTILQQLNDVAAYFGSLPMPRCFDCQECPIKDTCYIDQVIAFEKNLQQYQLAFMSQTEEQSMR